MDIDEVMKETFSAILVDAKLERSIVIQVMAPLAHPAKVSRPVYTYLHGGIQHVYRSCLHIPRDVLFARHVLVSVPCPLAVDGSLNSHSAFLNRDSCERTMRLKRAALDLERYAS